MYKLDGPLDDDSRIVELDDGFERFGGQDTPFLLREGHEKRRKARAIYQERDLEDRDENEQTHNPVTRDVDEWRSDLQGHDFPFVDTIPAEIMLDRAEGSADVAMQLDLLKNVEYDFDFESDTLLGQYLPIKRIELDAHERGFLGFRRGVILAHEVGHAFADALGPDSGIDDDPTLLFTSDTQRSEAKRISRRLHGPIPDPAEAGTSHYREGETELFAEVFASLVVEAETTFRKAPNAAARVETLLQNNFDARATTIIDL